MPIPDTRRVTPFLGAAHAAAITVVALVAVGGCAHDGGSASHPSSNADRRDVMQQRLADADRNGDGPLSREEAAALPRLAERFSELDGNADGVISREELAAAAKARGGRR